MEYQGDSATLRVHLWPGERRDYTVASASLPNAAGIEVGAPVVARFHGPGYESIAALIGAVWGRGNGPGTDEAGAVARGEFFLCVIPREISGAPETWWREG